MKKIITTFIAALALSTGCAQDDIDTDIEVAEEEEYDNGLEAPNAGELDSNLDDDDTDEDDDDVSEWRSEAGDIDELTAPVSEDDLGDDADYELAAPFVNDCNICVRTAKGATCTIKACEQDDTTFGAAPESDGPDLNRVWAESCNVCTNTKTGSICTMMACVSDDR